MRTFTQKPKATQQTTSAKSSKPSRSFVGKSSNTHSILHLQRAVCNQVVRRLLQTATEGISASSARSASTACVHDYSRIPVHTGGYSNIQPKQKVNAQYIDENLKNQLYQRKGGGSPLSDETRAFFEPRMQVDFSKVRIHTDNKAFQMNRQLSARAFTHGRDIFFGAAQYNPDSYDGKRLLAHELTHVVQQNGLRHDPIKNVNPLHVHRESSPSIMRGILLKIVQYQGSSITDPNIDVQIANHIYNQCNNLNVAAAPVNNVDALNSLSDLRGDTSLDFDSRVEVDAVKRRANANGIGEVPVAYVQDILLNNRRGFSGYTLHGLVAVSNRSRQPHILAHEVGHFFDLVHDGHGSRDLMYEDPETITYIPSHPPRLLLSDCRTLRSRIQPKLTVSTPGDIYEKEADRVADQVMRMSEPHYLQDESVCTCDGECPERLKKQGNQKSFQKNEIQSNHDRKTGVQPNFQEILLTPGQQLCANNRAFLKPCFNYDFSNVPVHIQRALPAITEPSAPNLATMDPATRTQLRTFVQNWESTGGNPASATSATVLATSWLESQGIVQYSGQSDIVHGSPFYLRSPSPQAHSAASPRPIGGYRVAGFTFNTTTGTTPLYKVEIYPRGLLGDSVDDRIGFLLGVIVHEYMHILQFRAGATAAGQPAEAQREFQAWLWQAEHFRDLGIRSRTSGSSQISQHLQTYFSQLSPADQVAYQSRYQAAQVALNASR